MCNCWLWESHIVVYFFIVGSSSKPTRSNTGRISQLKKKFFRFTLGIWTLWSKWIWRGEKTSCCADEINITYACRSTFWNLQHHKTKKHILYIHQQNMATTVDYYESTPLLLSREINDFIQLRTTTQWK